MHSKLVKKSALRGAMKNIQKAAQAGPLSTLILLDNEDGTGTLMGETAGGNLVDISTVAALVPDPTSSDTSKVTVAVVSGVTFKVSAVGPVTADPVTVTVTATWNDGSIGPFFADIPVTVAAGPVTGVVPTFGPPVIH